MPSADPLVQLTEPIAAPRKRRARRAQAGQRRAANRDRRVTSWSMTAADERVLDALREHYGTEIIGEAFRRGLRAAAVAEGIDIAPLEQDVAA